MNRKIENYIRLAMDELKKEKSLAKEFKGYLSSLGPAINMSGLIPAIAFYSAKENAKADRSKVIAWIFNILKKQNEWPGIGNTETLLDFAIRQTDQRKLQKDVEDISVALKLTLRTFSLTD